MVKNMTVKKNSEKNKSDKKTSSTPKKRKTTGSSSKKTSSGRSGSKSGSASGNGRNLFREITGVVLGLSGLFILICIIMPEVTGKIGESVNYAFTFWLGQASYLFPLLVLYVGILLFLRIDTGISHHWVLILVTVLLLDASVFIQLLSKDGGLVGQKFSAFLINSAGVIGAYFFTIGTGLIIFLALTQFSLERTSSGFSNFLRKFGKLLRKCYRFLAFQSSQSSIALENGEMEDIPELFPQKQVSANKEQNIPEPSPDNTDISKDEQDSQCEDEDKHEDSLDLLKFDDNQSIQPDNDNSDNDIDESDEKYGSFSNDSDKPVDDDNSSGSDDEPDDDQDTEEMDLPGIDIGFKKPDRPEPPDKPDSSGSGNAVIPPLVTGTPDGKPQGYEQFGLPEYLSPEPEVAFKYEFPPVSLLKGVEKEAEEKSARDYSKLLEETLANFGVEVKVINKIRGPAVTRYELQPAKGVKVKKVTNLANDIALSLAAYSIRIEAPIPGKSAIGIEVPNHRIDPVSLRDILIEGDYRRQPPINLALGKDITGKPVMDNLLKMPHLLIAGSTGSGKSVCINCLITSILYNCSPMQIQMIMVDPKRVELSMFEGIPHLVDIKLPGGKKIITDPKAATIALKNVCDIMDQRYEDFVEMKVRNIKEYNQKAEIPLPYIITIIDELADLMMVSSATVEQFICRIAQLGRASGIHLIVATQRPSVDVITGLIKANIPSRIAFAVSSQIDSRTILDRAGAEKLLGKGDMLYLPVDANEPRRIQGAYVSSEETEKIVDFWRMQPMPDNAIPIEISGDLDKRGRIIEGGNTENDDEERDPLIDEAIEVIRSTAQASVSNLQRKMKIGYARAGRIMDQLEKLGIVGPPDGSKPRRINLPGH
jgi:DNA segregation ATPase FtsK/SpoIIIE, S-DNA-T family